jgi:hypothetical protein
MPILSKKEAARLLWARAARLEKLAAVISVVCRDHSKASALMGKAEQLSTAAMQLHWS